MSERPSSFDFGRLEHGILRSGGSVGTQIWALIAWLSSGTPPHPTKVGSNDRAAAAGSSGTTGVSGRAILELSQRFKAQICVPTGWPPRGAVHRETSPSR